MAGDDGIRWNAIRQAARLVQERLAKGARTAEAT